MKNCCPFTGRKTKRKENQESQESQGKSDGLVVEVGVPKPSAIQQVLGWKYVLRAASS